MGARVALSILLLASLGVGCGKPPPLSEFGLLVTKPDIVHPLVVKRGVRGEWCFAESFITTLLRPPWNARLADHGRALEDALAQHPTANVMSNAHIMVRVEQYLLFQRICAVVQGDVGRLE